MTKSFFPILPISKSNTYGILSLEKLTVQPFNVCLNQTNWIDDSDRTGIICLVIYVHYPPPSDPNLCRILAWWPKHYSQKPNKLKKVMKIVTLLQLITNNWELDLISQLELILHFPSKVVGSNFTKFYPFLNLPYNKKTN